MKRQRYIYITVLLVAAAVSSCQSWFDISPKSELKADDLLKNEQGYRDALIGCYALMAKPELYGAQLTYTYADVLAQYYATASGTLHNFRYACAYNYKVTNEETRINAIWKNLYNVVANANNLLQTIESHRDVFTEGHYELIRGEALAVRAYIHLDLLRLFAPSVSRQGLGAPAIPYVDTFTNQMQRRLTVGEVIDRILADLAESRTLLSQVDPYGPRHASYDLTHLTGLLEGRAYRMNYYAATALQARALLYRGGEADKRQAYAAAREVIDSGLFPLISSDDISSADQNGFVRENICALEFTNLKEKQIDTYFHTSNASANMLALNSSTLSKVFPASINADYRRQYWIQESGSYYTLTKYDYSERIPLLKIGEMYLICAETAESLEERQAWYNSLTYQRGQPEEELTGKDLNEVLRHEYAREFIGEGQLFYACKRMGYDRLPVLETAVADPDAVYTLPIPTENTYFAE